MDIIIYLNRNTNTITLADAEAAGKCNLVFEMIIHYGFLKKLNYFRRTFQVAGAANTNLNYHHNLYLGKNVLAEEFVNSIGSY